jgi:protoporphyrinogen oxidase
MIVIIGAGLSGITVARRLKKPFVILERDGAAGGLAAEYSAGGHRLGHGGHYFHFQNKIDILDYVKGIHPFTQYRRKSHVFLDGRFIPYPIQFHLAHLPARERKTVLQQMLDRKQGASRNLENFLLNHFGARLHHLFFNPFLSKFYGRDLSDLMADMDKGSIPVPDLNQVIEGARGKEFTSAGYNASFYYPAVSMNHFLDLYAAPVADRIRFHEEVIGIDTAKQQVITGSGPVDYDRLVSTIPLKHLLTMRRTSGRGLPSPGTSELDHISTVVANVVLKRRRRRFHWIYLPEKRFSFYRAGYYPPPGPVRCYLEKTVTRPDSSSAKSLSEETVYTLKETGMIRDRSEISFIDYRQIPVSYVIFNRHWKETVPPILADLRERGIFSIGRYGSWNYTSMSDDIQSAMHTADQLNHR